MAQFTIKDLSVAGREVYDRWRAYGMTEAQALNEVSVLESQTRLAETYAARGILSPDAARIAAAGRDHHASASNPFDALVETYMAGRGMSRQAAEFAAAGRDRSVAEARRDAMASRPAIERKTTEATPAPAASGSRTIRLDERTSPSGRLGRPIGRA